MCTTVGDTLDLEALALSLYSLQVNQALGVASPEIFGGKMFDFRPITLFCLEKRLSKHKMTIFSKPLGGHGPPATPMPLRSKPEMGPLHSPLVPPLAEIRK